jgi:hypothetical protein
VVKNVDAVGLHIARLAYAMHYSLGTRAHVMRSRRLHACLCARLGKVFGARSHPATIAYNAKASVLAARQHVLQSLETRCIATRDTKEWQPKTCASLVRCICHCTVNSVVVSCMALSNKKACNRAARATRSNEPFTTRPDTRTDRQTDGHRGQDFK